MAPEERPPQPTVSDEIEHQEDDEGDWEDATSSEEQDDDEDEEEYEDSSTAFADMASDIRQVIELAEQNNVMLQGLMSHPKLNASNPAASPKPLFFVADFVRRTYLEYALPLLPPRAVYESPRIANPFVIKYEPNECPQPPANGELDDSYLHDPSNWPDEKERKSKEYKEKCVDLLTRTQTAAIFIKDSNMMKTVTGQTFDWSGGPVPLLEIAQKITA